MRRSIPIILLAPANECFVDDSTVIWDWKKDGKEHQKRMNTKGYRECLVASAQNISNTNLSLSNVIKFRLLFHALLPAILRQPLFFSS